MYAVINFKGHQYKVKEGDKFVVNRLETEEGKNLTVKEVLMTFDEAETDIKVGHPFVEGGKVELKVLSHRLGDKIRVFKMKAKKRYMRNKGHRQNETVVEVVKIG
ncbi:50S ribosomal protein L21 [Candidatus Peregrinibacteria bacterium CG11_big_fil_rev_8_21_14_0_20_41_10]|nr:MAG: 50S ribosomal protein L21 [Candidatus Peregrinibacteria bacterium CG11_big_fil_rev_8_21_14_0_20_41_10]PIZ78026.1 MAG: 50S ribosomal protein L21 [Candidatus Peregrinibacteria bacterium CG_4_10_14_0_2_um_filter_41_8]PJC38387.1 MAG: 50S ribosomal protein L21 [Candidatus Peregrinibacteria bacterium CG_4_9_14_0_2_um_filter_41_14]